MFDTLIQKVALVIAAKVAEEVMERLPDISDMIADALPDIAERIVQEVLDRIPFLR